MGKNQTLFFKKNYVSSTCTKGGWVGMGYDRKGQDRTGYVRLTLTLNTKLVRVQFPF
jgi:hypothetical protein